jgi:teichuronic acid biosynthesis glycosyltransferase TuaC
LESKLQVVQITPGYPCEATKSVGTFYRNQAEALARQGVEVEVVAPVHAVPPGLEFISSRACIYKHIPKEYKIGGVSVLRPRYFRLTRNSLTESVIRSYARCALKVIKSRPDIVHAHYGVPYGNAALILSKKWGVPSVLTLHGSDVNVLPDINEGTLSFFNQSVKESQAVIAVSKALADKTERIAGRRPLVMPIGINMRIFSNLPRKDEARNLLGLPKDRKIVLYVGNLLHTKGILELIEASTVLEKKGISCVLVGVGPLSAKASDAPSVILTGAVSNNEVPLYMAAADLFILPSYSEGLPTVLVEAGATGLPVIATKVGGNSELLAENRGVLIDERSVEAIVNAVKDGLKDYMGAMERAKKLRSYVQTFYDVDNNARELLLLYKRTFCKDYRKKLNQA